MTTLNNTTTKRPVVSYCCGSYHRGQIGGVARYDYQLSLAFPHRQFFKAPPGSGEKHRLLEFLKNSVNKGLNPLVITDNHLACDIPNEYEIFLVHHGCAKTTATRNPGWPHQWIAEAQDRMLDHRDPASTTIISISKACTEDFTQYYKEKYTKFNRFDVLHPSELNEKRYKTNFNSSPVVLGNWTNMKKGKSVMPNVKSTLSNFRFQQLQVQLSGNNFLDFNKRKQDIYLNSDIFLQISNSEGNSYATLDALLCGIPVVASNVGLFYKDIPEDCFVKMDWRKNGEVKYVAEKLKEAWENRENISKNAREWYMSNCRLENWRQKMISLVEK